MSRGVHQGCPLSPLLFALAVEMLALKVRQEQICLGIELPNGQNAKISQFADDSTLINLEDTRSLRNAMSTEFIWSIVRLAIKLKGNRSFVDRFFFSKNTLEFECPEDPIQFLGTYLSLNEAGNDNKNFYIKIRIMEGKLNIWLSRDLTLRSGQLPFSSRIWCQI